MYKLPEDAGEFSGTVGNQRIKGKQTTVELLKKEN